MKHQPLPSHIHFIHPVMRTAICGPYALASSLGRSLLLQMASKLASVVKQVVGRGEARSIQLILFLFNPHTGADQMKHC